MYDNSFRNNTGNRIYEFLNWLGFKIKELSKSSQFVEKHFLTFNPRIEEFHIRKTRLKFYVTSELMRRFLLDFHDSEPQTLDWIENFRDGEVFYDLGASSGPFSIYAALKSKSEVISFEPSAQNFAILDRNCYLNNHKIKYPIKLFNIALSNDIGVGTLYIYSYEGAGGRQLDKKVSRGGKQFPTAHLQTTIKENLDSMIERYQLPLPNHIKIDVDGSEKMIIEGAKKTLKNPKLKSLLIELDDNDKKKNQILRMIRNSGFILCGKFQVAHYKSINNHIFTRSYKDE